MLPAVFMRGENNMLAKKIKYVDFDGVERNETFYFNISEAEATELELEEDGGLISLIMRLIEAQNVPKLFKVFKKLIGLSVGEKSNDGKYLMKSDEITAKFFATNAYNNLFMEIISSPDAAANFVNSIVPANVAAQASQYEVKNGEIVNKDTGESIQPGPKPLV